MLVCNTQGYEIDPSGLRSRLGVLGERCMTPFQDDRNNRMNSGYYGLVANICRMNKRGGDYFKAPIFDFKPKRK